MRPVDTKTPCIECGLPALGRSAIEAAKREVTISGICGVCWDNMFSDESEDGEEDEGSSDKPV